MNWKRVDSHSPTETKQSVLIVVRVERVLRNFPFREDVNLVEERSERCERGRVSTERAEKREEEGGESVESEGSRSRPFSGRENG